MELRFGNSAQSDSAVRATCLTARILARLHLHFPLRFVIVSHMEDDEPGEAELRPLLREALAVLRQMQLDPSVRPKLKEFAEGKISASEPKLWLRGP